MLISIPFLQDMGNNPYIPSKPESPMVGELVIIPTCSKRALTQFISDRHNCHNSLKTINN